MPLPLIDVKNLSKSFGKNRILENLSMEVKPGEVFGLVGLNGAGKTTLIRLLLGVLRATEGTITVLNRNPWSHDAALHRRMGVVLENDGFCGNLTFYENMRIFGDAKRVRRKDFENYLEEHWRDTDIRASKKPVKYFSRGQHVQCALCRAFLGWPDVYLLDEPVVALDVGAYDHFTKLVRHASSRGAAFVVSSHQLDAIDELCSDVGMLRNKTVSRLPKVSVGSDIAKPWEIGADYSETWGAIIEEVCGTPAAYEDHCWRFGVVSADETIPRLVKRLVEAGCAVRRVHPTGQSFSMAIKNEYLKKTASSGGQEDRHA